jgi:hypothetical protein
MHVGILAACLPTLKPLFASCFGQMRTLTKGRTTGSNAISAPFKSNGYVKQEDGVGGSFAMKNMSEGSRPRSQYDEDVVLGKETYTVTTNASRRGPKRSHAGDSDESILSHENRRSDGLARGMGIVRTTEVSVTR